MSSKLTCCAEIVEHRDCPNLVKIPLLLNIDGNEEEEVGLKICVAKFGTCKQRHLSTALPIPVLLEAM